MNIRQVEEAYYKHQYTACPITESLIKAGYQQTGGGYIDRAKREGVIVDYRMASPTQWWHLMIYCQSRKPSQPFTRTIVCGELIFWMAEVSGYVAEDELAALVDEIASDENYLHTRKYDRKKWNRRIQEVCFEAIEAYVEATV